MFWTGLGALAPFNPLPAIRVPDFVASVIDRQTHTVIDVIALANGSYPVAVAVTADGTLYITDLNGAVTRIYGDIPA